jgi:hypothetical protein
MRMGVHCNDSRGIHRSPRRRLAALSALVGVVLVFAGANCAPAARSANCSNDGECSDADSGRAYCVQSRCVECVTNAACGDHKRCAAGSCVPRGS